MLKAFAGLVTLTTLAGACAGYPPVVQQASLADQVASTPASDSAVYAVFLETMNRGRLDTLHVEELSKIFVRLPAQYDTMAPGLNATLARVSQDQRPSDSLHLPPPVRVMPQALIIALNNAGVIGDLGAVEGKPQGTNGLWTFTPVAYTADGNDAMFAYSELCGKKCGEDVIVWERKNAAGKWEVRHTLIQTIE
ncbi:MAG TPA: hypothetical protein VGG76_10245 [Gemmatimonadaceae bacterium]|jgi:hypothetical protein